MLKRSAISNHLLNITILFYLIVFTIPVFAKSDAILKVEQFGAKGDGKTNDTKALNAAFLSAAKTGQPLHFASNKSYLIDSISLVGIQYAEYKKLELVGNGATLRCINRGNRNVVKLMFLDIVMIRALNIIGNKANKIDGNGFAVYYVKQLDISACNVQECKLSGVLIAWVKSAKIVNNTIHDNGDGTLPSDGIGIHSLSEGTISYNTVYNNNPLFTDDGDGIQIGMINYSINQYYDHYRIGTIKVNHNICYKNGRRGIKIQRSNVIAEKNFLSDIGISVVNGIDLIHNIQLQSNVIQKSYKGITLDGGGKLNISNVNITDNYFLGSITTDRILLQDASGVNIVGNSFDRHSIKVLDAGKKEVKYANILFSTNVRNIDSSKSRLINMQGSTPILSTQPNSSKEGNGKSVLINVTAKTMHYTPAANEDLFCVFNNFNIDNAKINVSYKGKISTFLLNKNKVLVIYAVKNSLQSFRY